ncbi:branched-chain amino acid ABC transporter permease [Desulfotalea psychrophila]|uniref:Probable high-affinity branched-chain amino acid ABC transporter, permease protein n=1 Tax=Desulfotalea psychrophila (strain LSv54 / DSM 12343) TaxID=177439 RepID=Q6AKA9_DESPS|nr:branched-chain amino acid ABC transporter permease [Desulfotalea psychrophila]CAG37217.1 probable high-affinity branched-chain amino acid ABC transporter, permease protein [Desulfotalea psychrophila LSv54]
MMKKIEQFGYPLFFLLMLSLPALLDSRWLAVATTFVVFSIVALSMDIILGKAGMFNMGQALFFGMGAYISAILNAHFGWPMLATVPAAIIIPAIFGVILAGPIVHLRGDYLLVASIGFNIVFIQVVQNDLGGVTGGPNGIFGLDMINLPGFMDSPQLGAFYAALIALFLTFLLMYNLAKSKAGRALHYLREDELAASCVGINTRVYKIFAFAVGAGIAGMAGTFYANQYSAVSPEAFNFLQSVLFFSIVIVGGSSIPGILLGVFVMFVLPEIFRDFATWRYFIFGLAMIVTMIIRPRGICPAKFGKIPKRLIKEGSYDIE